MPLLAGRWATTLVAVLTAWTTEMFDVRVPVADFAGAESLLRLWGA
jgi:hypothetical protein